jgi:hypothetical protein
MCIGPTNPVTEHTFFSAHLTRNARGDRTLAQSSSSASSPPRLPNPRLIAVVSFFSTAAAEPIEILPPHRSTAVAFTFSTTETPSPCFSSPRKGPGIAEAVALPARSSPPQRPSPRSSPPRWPNPRQSTRRRELRLQLRVRPAVNFSVPYALTEPRVALGFSPA